ncbi:KTSC domain-containing protein [Clavibacter nebraskensis]|uniref:KTSC domain-containing protein n=1 Tax=Clavibacter nebraskensis TaxID=31963 RepID=A0ABY4MMI4_9MICO|nr:KTSC domain-containing protein [Clavibacter nebraskensis]QGV70213.1 KTSC domain-containing protein [Clavibacter nebraskensis]QGV73004.1 KTSC domain-containing protein [Clavibacter nebraskensis]UQB04486.1 KTSC domain-containing protein [Clavibacter nebraskensis]UQB07310.1 KTSC domain-containing protein [Clavibacter nebraskensis]
MNKTPVSSSNIAAVGYDAQSLVLEVEFLNGATYQYFDVPRAEYDGLIQAQSVGSYFAKSIKSTYRYSRI